MVMDRKVREAPAAVAGVSAPQHQQHQLANATRLPGARHAFSSRRAPRTPSPDQLARRFIPLARTQAWRASRRHRLPFDVVLCDALLGLTHAIARCEPGRPLAPYALQLINGEILHGIRDRVGQRGAHERGEPLVVTVPLHDPRRPDAEPLEERYPGQLSTPDHAACVIEAVSLWAAVAELPARERQMIVLSYRSDLSQTQIGARLGCSQMEVSRGLRRAYARLQPHVRP